MNNYQKTIARHWERGFLYDRSHAINNNVSIQTYKILMHYTDLHKNCRVGCYLMTNSFSQFFTLQQLIGSFDLFANAAEKDEKLIVDSFPDKVNPTIAQLDKIWRLKYPIRFEFSSKSIWNNIFGYNHNKSISIEINPNDILELEGQSLHSFKITCRHLIIDVAFRDKITIR